MRAMLHSWWQTVRKHWVISTIVLIATLGLFIFAGYRLSWDWTGFNEHIGPNVQQNQPSKTLWDWLQLLAALAIPVVVALGAAWFTAQQGKANDRENTDNQREAALQSYIDKISELLLEKQLNTSPKGEVRQIARIRTLTVLRRLDATRKGSVLQFLREANLIEKDTCIVDLSSADLSNVNLTFANFHKAELSRANLSRAIFPSANFEGTNFREANLMETVFVFANLSGASLEEANLSGASLMRANLSGASLEGANLSGASLRGANLTDTNLSRANLTRVDLRKAAVTKEQLATVKSLEGATMPDGKIYSDQFFSTRPTSDKK
jgi:uncharacterized protein YjbI with pentapeptide repeats